MNQNRIRPRYDFHQCRVVNNSTIFNFGLWPSGSGFVRSVNPLESTCAPVDSGLNLEIPSPRGRTSALSKRRLNGRRPNGAASPRPSKSKSTYNTPRLHMMPSEVASSHQTIAAEFFAHGTSQHQLSSLAVPAAGTAVISERSKAADSSCLVSISSNRSRRSIESGFRCSPHLISSPVSYTALQAPAHSFANKTLSFVVVSDLIMLPNPAGRSFLCA